MTDGGFRPDGTFVSWPALDTARLTEPFRRAGLRRFVRLALFDANQAAGMLTGPHAGFHVHPAVWVSEDDRAFATRLARYGARNPVALDRLTYDRRAKAVTYRSDKSEGPTAGTETVDPLEFLARVLVHLPDTGQVTTRYSGWYATRPRGPRDKAAPAADGPPAMVPAPRLAPTEASRRWAKALRRRSSSRSSRSDPLACPSCHGPMRVVALLTQASVIHQILTPLRTRAAHATHAGARSPPATRAPRAGARHAPHAVPPTLRVSPEFGPEAPPPHGDLWRGWRSHLGGPAAPPAPGSPVRTADRTAHEARKRDASGAEGTPPPIGRCSRGR